MEVLFGIAASIFTLVLIVKLTRKKRASDPMQLEELDPREPMDYEFVPSRKNSHSRPQKASRAVHSNRQPTSGVGKGRYKFPGFSHAKSYIVRQEPN